MEGENNNVALNEREIQSWRERALSSFGERGSRSRTYWTWGLGIFILILLIVLVWANFFWYRECSNAQCFADYLKNCRSSKFDKTGAMQFQYRILGIREGQCAVSVKLLQGDLNNEDSRKIEGDSMDCLLPKGMVVVPEAEIAYCHGVLKEGLQDLIISKMHKYIVQNLGDVKDAF